jgi:membrane protein YdbS with pleckstrin-like domain
MGFPAKLLNPGEEVALDLRPHWKFLSAPVCTVVAMAAASLAALIEGIPRLADLALAAALVLCLLWLAGRWLRWASSSFVVTTQRLVVRRGVLRRTAREILLDRLTDISSSQTLLDRLLRCGDVLVESPGRDSPEVFKDLPRPAAVRNLICQLVVQSRAGGFSGGGVSGGGVSGGGVSGGGVSGGGFSAGGGTVPDRPEGEGPGRGWGARLREEPGFGAPGGPEDIAGQLARLGELRRRGVISRREFATKKAELLSRM